MRLLKQLFLQFRRARATPAQANAAYGPPPSVAAGLALQQKGEHALAESVYRDLVRREPGDSEALHLLGNSLTIQQKYAEAIEPLRMLVGLRPDFAEAHLSLGLALRAQGAWREAASAFERATALSPDSLGAWLSLAAVMTDLQDIDRAEQAHRRVIELKPDLAEVHANLGLNLVTQGRLDEAIAAYRRVLALNPGSAHTHSNLVYTLNFHPGYSPEEIFAEHRRWSERHAEPLRDTLPPPRPDPSPARRLRIGYVSPDFRQHSVCYFFEPVLAHHDYVGFDVYCYSDVATPDQYTRRLQTYGATWRNIRDSSDDDAAAAIRRDCIDILIDLTGHTKDNRLLVFARRPAPIQVTWSGYINTTGLSAMDYRITDGHMDPPGASEHLYSERLLRLPDIYTVFRPPPDAPAVNPLPALTQDHVTFACFNGRFKISTDDMRVWADVLHAVPRSRLLLAPISPGNTRRALIESFQRRGITSDRIECLGPMPYAAYLAIHQRVDMILDTFPAHGVTTTSHGLWMGVPVIVLAGDRCVSRAGTSLLANLGLQELVARSREEYFDIAVRLASDLPRLAALRSRQRESMSRAINTDGPAFTRKLESAYRTIWHTWCAERPA